METNQFEKELINIPRSGIRDQRSSNRCLILKALEKGLSVKIRGYSSAGRAPALQAGGQRFDPAYLHHEKQQLFNNGLRNNEPNQYGLIAQPVRAHA